MNIIKRDGLQTMVPDLWNNFFNHDIFGWDSNFAMEGQSLPAVNIKETNDEYLVEMAAPGMKKEDFKIQLDGTALTISSEHKEETKSKENENYNRREFSYQSFYRTFHLPKDVVDSEKIQAKYKDGILKLQIPKRETAKQKPARLINVQ